MKIKQLKIEGFRSLKNVTWEPDDLNILIGPNGTGKSNLLRFLEFTTVAVKGGLGKYIQSQGGISTQLWDGDVSEIYSRMDFRLSERSTGYYELKLSEWPKVI